MKEVKYIHLLMPPHCHYNGPKKWITKKTTIIYHGEDFQNEVSIRILHEFTTVAFIMNNENSKYTPYKILSH